MAKVAFTADELAEAKQTETVLIAFEVNGRHLRGFPHKSYADGGCVPADLAAEAVEWWQGFSKRVRAAQADAAKGESAT